MYLVDRTQFWTKTVKAVHSDLAGYIVKCEAVYSLVRTFNFIAGYIYVRDLPIIDRNVRSDGGYVPCELQACAADLPNMR